MRIVERVAYAARIAAKTFWDEQFQVVTQVDKDGIPTGTTGSPTVTTNAAIGTTTDAPVADNTTPEGATERTLISLAKRVANIEIAQLAKLPTVTGSGAVPTVCEPDMGAAVYSTTKGHFAATPAADAKTITIVWDVDKCVPAPFTLAAGNVRRVQKVSSTGVRTELPVSTVTVVGLVITLADAANFAAGDTVNVWLQGAEMTNWVDVLQEVTVPPAGVTGSFDLYALIGDGRQYEEIMIMAHRKTTGKLMATGTTDNSLRLKATGIAFDGNADGTIQNIIGAVADFSVFGMKWSKHIAAVGWQVLGSAALGATGALQLNLPYFRQLAVGYVFKGDAADFTAVIHVHAKRMSK